MKKSNAPTCQPRLDDEATEKLAEETLAMLMVMREDLGLRAFQPLSEVTRPKSMKPKRFSHLVKIFKEVEALHLECAAHLNLPASVRKSFDPVPPL